MPIDPQAIDQSGAIALRLAYRAPMQLSSTLQYLARRAIAGVEHYDGTTYQRTLRLPHGPGQLWLRPADGYVSVQLRLAEHRDLAAAVARTRRLLDLDADPLAVDEVLSTQAGAIGLAGLAELVRRRPGLRSPGAVDGFEMALRAVIGQQISVAGARTVLARITAEHGTVAFADNPEWLLFPEPAALAAADPASLPMPTARGATVVALATAMASGRLTLSADSERAETRQALLAIRGVGPWTADYLLMRALGDPDVYLGSDLGIKHALAALADRVDPVAAAQINPVAAAQINPVAAAPWRSYLTHHLWASLGPA